MAENAPNVVVIAAPNGDNSGAGGPTLIAAGRGAAEQVITDADAWRKLDVYRT